MCSFYYTPSIKVCFCLLYTLKYIVEDLKTGGREDLKRGDSDPRNHIKFSHWLARILELLSVGRQSLERCGNKMTFHIKDLIYSSLAHLQIKCFVSILFLLTQNRF